MSADVNTDIEPFSSGTTQTHAEPTEQQGLQEDQQAAPSQRTTPPGYDPIDLNDATPEQVQERINYLYRQIKDQKRTESTLNEYRQIAEEQARAIEELTNGLSGVAGHLQDKAYIDTEARLSQEMQVAFESGDMKGFLDAQTKLIDLKAERKFAEKQSKPQPKQQQPKQQQQHGGGLDQQDQYVVNTWQDERDEQGNLLRPWAHNRSTDPNNPDPQYLHALAETSAVLNSPRFTHYTMEQKMAEVDKRMGLNKPPSRQTVLEGNLTGARKAAKVTLTPKQQEIAIRTKFGGPNAKSDAEHLDAYRKQIEQSKRASQ